MKPYKDPRLNKLMGEPERVVQTDESVALDQGLLVKFGRREQSRLEQDLAARTLAQLLVKARTQSGLTVRKAATLLGRHPSRVGAIEQGSSGLAFRTFVAYARSLGYDIEIKLIPTDPSRTPLTAVLSSEPLATEPTPQTAR